MKRMQTIKDKCQKILWVQGCYQEDTLTPFASSLLQLSLSKLSVTFLAYKHVFLPYSCA